MTVARGSWYSQFSGNYHWVDPGDRPGSNALHVPDSMQGIALPSRSTLGQWFNVTAPNGVTLNLQQTDIGPASFTGRGIDISAAAADKFGYSPSNFPTNGYFTFFPSNGPMADGVPDQGALGGSTVPDSPGVHVVDPTSDTPGTGVTPSDAS